MVRVMALCGVLAAGCSRPAARPAAAIAPDSSGGDLRRVILFVADGAGVAHWSAAYLQSDSLSVAGFPVVGLVDPANTSRNLPESASGATAFALGVRTYYRGLGVGADSIARSSVLEAAEQAGLATGLVTTTFLVDATPAAFAAHVSDRNRYREIARQIAAKDIEVLLGDGRRHLTTGFVSRRPIEGLRDRYVFVESAEELRALDPDTIEMLLGLFDIDRVADPDRREPALAEMTAAALEILGRDPEGFFLLVENEHTDHLSHDNAPLEAIREEVLHLDRAIQQALAYRSRHPETLIVVAGDHETGGLAIVADSTRPRGSDGRLIARYGTTGHSAELIPIFAIGPGAERFGGIQTNAEIGRHLMKLVVGADGR